LIAAALKAAGPCKRARGFESLPLRILLYSTTVILLSLLQEWHLCQPVLIYGIEPRSVRSISHHLFHVVPTPYDAHQPIPRGQVTLPANAEDAEASCHELSYLNRLSSYALISSDGHEVSASYRWDPLRIRYAKRTLGDQWMPNMDCVASRRGERFAEADGALVDVEAQRLPVSSHEESSVSLLASVHIERPRQQ
jgi:hypothetical protein